MSPERVINIVLGILVIVLLVVLIFLFGDKVF